MNWQTKKESRLVYYLDTSAINKFADILKPQDAFATRKLARQRKKAWVLSPLNLYEIFNTKDEKRRETIICRMAQFYSLPGCIFSTPTRILFYNILKYESQKTEFESSLYEAWFEITKNNKKTFIIDYNNFKKRDKNIKAFNRVIKWIIIDYIPKEPNKKSKDEIILPYILYKQIKVFSPNEDLHKGNDEKRLFYLKLILVLGIFCFGIEPESIFLDNYWKLKKINSTNDRFVYICTNFHSKIFESEVIDIMAKFLLFQSKQKKGIDRGAFRDSLHLIYCWYADLFITCDKDIYKFSKKEDFLNERVVLLSNENLERIKI